MDEKSIENGLEGQKCLVVSFLGVVVTTLIKGWQLFFGTRGKIGQEID